MRKNGSRLISLKQYKFNDLFLFAVILIVFDLVVHFATAWLADAAAMYMFSLTVPIVLLIMVRWGWPAVFYAIGDAILLTVLNNPTVWQSYLAYILGNSALMLLLIPLHFIGKQKIAGKWYLTALFVVLGWVISNLVCSIVQWICGIDFVVALASNVSFSVNGLLSLVLGVVLMLILRRLDGMFEDQIHYLKRLDDERKELARRDEFGDEPIEIDEDAMSILKRRYDDLE